MELEKILLPTGGSLVTLTSKNVSAIFRDCLYRDNEISGEEHPEDAIKINGLQLQIGFNPVRVFQHKSAILDMLSFINRDFIDPKAGGTSFVNLPFRNDGSQWGEQPNAQELMLIGMAINSVEYLMPRTMWAMFPGGMPYLKISLDV